MTDPTVVWLDTETTGLHGTRRAWDVAAIVRRPGQPDVEWQWFIDLHDLDLTYADPVSLDIGRFWDRHPQARWVKRKGDMVYIDYAAAPKPLPTDGVVPEQEMVTAVAGLTAGKAVIAGSNPPFDMQTLTPRMAWWDLTPGWHYHPEDTPGVARGWLLARAGAAPRKSDEIARACGVNPDDYERHTALGDCRMMRDLTDRVEGRWKPAVECSTGICFAAATTLADGYPHCEPCAAYVDPHAQRRQPLPTRTVLR